MKKKKKIQKSHFMKKTNIHQIQKEWIVSRKSRCQHFHEVRFVDLQRSITTTVYPVI